MKMTSNKWFIIIFLVLAVAGTGFYMTLKNKEAEITFTKVNVKRGDLIQRIQSTGTVSPQNRLEIKPPVPGRIDEILVKEGDVVRKGKILAWVSSNERAALMDSVRTQGAAEIKKWEALYKPTPVIAPINGTIILRNVETGQSFTNVDAIFVMADRLTVKAQVDETDIALIKMNQSAIITLDAYPNNPINGKVVHLAYDATLTNNVTTYQVDILPLDAPEFIRSGMTSNVSVEVARKDKVLLIPMTALNTDEEGAMVLIENGKKQSSLPVTTGMDDGKFVEITSGLTESDIVLIKDSGKKSKKTASSNPLFPSGGGRGRGGRK
jgi:macrolide-specific efflux system membrane fusion protein